MALTWAATILAWCCCFSSVLYGIRFRHVLQADQWWTWAAGLFLSIGFGPVVTLTLLYHG